VIDLVDLGVNPHLSRSARPFETFHRIDREAIDAWFQAQLHRRDQWDRAPLDPSSPVGVAIGNGANDE